MWNHYLSFPLLAWAPCALSVSAGMPPASAGCIGMQTVNEAHYRVGKTPHSSSFPRHPLRIPKSHCRYARPGTRRPTPNSNTSPTPSSFQPAPDNQKLCFLVVPDVMLFMIVVLFHCAIPPAFCAFLCVPLCPFCSLHVNRSARIHPVSNLLFGFRHAFMRFPNACNSSTGLQ